MMKFWLYHYDGTERRMMTRDEVMEYVPEDTLQEAINGFIVPKDPPLFRTKTGDIEIDF